MDNDDKTFTQKVKDDIKSLAKNGICTFALLKFIKVATLRVRMKMMSRLMFEIFGPAMAMGVFSFIFRKEIAELMGDVDNLTTKALEEFVKIVKRFAKDHQKGTRASK